MQPEKTAPRGCYLHHQWIVDPGQKPIRIDRYLKNKLAVVSRQRIQVGIRDGYVELNGRTVKPSYLVRPGEEVVVKLPYPPRDPRIIPEDIPLDIVYEDCDLIVVNKPPAMVVHPAHGHWEGTLVHALAYHLGALPHDVGNEMRPGLVHRIDKGTSGLLVVAKSEIALRGLSHQFAARTIDRFYYALVWGEVQKESGQVDLPLGRSHKDRRVVTTYPIGEGKSAVTHYEVISRYRYTTLIKCRLETGRTHQIRAHMRALGHPLFGDERYGGGEVVVGPPYAKYRSFVRNNFSLYPYQLLHAAHLGFAHPITGERKQFEVNMPERMRQVIERWSKYDSMGK